MNHRPLTVAAGLLLLTGLCASARPLGEPAPLDAAARERRATQLRANGFVVDIDQMVENVEEPYVSLAHGSGPVFVSSDAMLYLWFEAHRTISRDLERQRLWPLTQRLTARLWASHQALLRAQAATPPTQRAAVRAAGEALSLRLAVAVRLSDPRASLPEGLAASVKTVVDRINAAAETLPYPGDDFTQYRPRGPYADDPTLARYFRLARWLGRQPIALHGAYASPDTVRQAAWLVTALRRDADALADYRRLTSARRLLAGAFNGSDADELGRALDTVLGVGWTPAALADDDACRRVTAELLKPGYTPLAVTTGAVYQGDPRFPTRGLALLPEHALPDSVLLQRNFDRRPEQPKPAIGLRVATALGLTHAATLLAAQAGAGEAEIAELRADGQQLCQPGSDSIHGRWLALLAALPLRDARAPAFMRTDAWADKTIATALTSWAQLRHNSVLYGAQPYMETLGIDSDSRAPLGWVEPNPGFWRQYAELCAGVTADLRRLNLLTSDAARLLSRLRAKGGEFAAAAESELAGRPLPDNGLSIQKFGYWVRDLPFDKPTVVADVATDQNLGVVHAASGYFHPITVLFPRPDGRELVEGQGLVGSYYEFARPGQRLTDKEWQALLAAEYATPEPPDWTSSFGFRANGTLDEAQRVLRGAQSDLIAGHDEPAVAALRQLEAAHPDSELAARARLVLAEEYERREDWAKAAAELEDLDRWYGCQQTDRAKRLRREIEWQSKAVDDAAAEARKLQTRLAATEPRAGLSGAEELARQDARALVLLTPANRYRPDAKVFARAIDECPRSGLLPAARLLVAAAPFRPYERPRGDTSALLPPLDAVEHDYPGSWLAEKAVALAATLLAPTDLDVAFARLQPYLGAARGREPYPEAVKCVQAALSEASYVARDERPARAVMDRLAEPLLQTAYEQGRFDRFETIWQALGGRSHNGAVAELGPFVRYFAPREPAVLRLWAAAHAIERGNPSVTLLRDLVGRYPRSELAPWALFELTETRHQANGFTAAQLRDVERLRRDYPTSAAALFRRADVAKRNGENARAKALEAQARARIANWPPRQMLVGGGRMEPPGGEELPEEALAPWRPLLPGLSREGLQDAVRRIGAWGEETSLVTAWVTDLRRLLPALTTDDLVHYAAGDTRYRGDRWPTALDELCRKAGGVDTPLAAEVLLAADRASKRRNETDLTAATRFATSRPADPRSAPLRLRLIAAGREPFLTTAINAGAGPEFQAAVGAFERLHAPRDREAFGDTDLLALAAEHHGKPLAALALLTRAGQMLRHGWPEQAVDCYVRAASEAYGGPFAQRAAGELAAAQTALANKRQPPMRPEWTVSVSGPLDAYARRGAMDGPVPSMVLDADRLYAPLPLPGGQSGLVAVRRDTGAQAWRVPLGGVHALAVAAGTVYCTTANRLLALDAATGALRWQVRRRSAGPLVALPDGVLQVTGSGLRRLRAADGAVVWDQPGEPLAPGEPLVVGDRVLLACVGRNHAGALRALALADGRPLWQVALSAGRATEGEPKAGSPEPKPRQPWLCADGSALLASETNEPRWRLTLARYDVADGHLLDTRAGLPRLDSPGWKGEPLTVGRGHLLLGVDRSDTTACYELASAGTAWRSDRITEFSRLSLAPVAAMPGGFLYVQGRTLGVRDPGTGALLRRALLSELVADVAVSGGTVFCLTTEGSLLRFTP